MTSITSTTRTTSSSAAGTPVPADGRLAFPPEHYGCPPWCETNRSGYVNHDSGDGMPDWPRFVGYTHHASLYMPYAAAPANPPGSTSAANPLSVHLELGPETISPGLQIAVVANDHDINLTLVEAEALAAAIMQLASAARAAIAAADA
jgi:hypothetical protein